MGRMNPHALWFVFALITALLQGPRGAAAQPAKVVTIGVLAIEAWPPIDALRQGFRDLGYVEDRNIRFEYRYAEGRNERFPELAAELIALKVDAIVTWGTDAVLAAKRATPRIPIVMGAIGDAVGTGVVSSLARPGGNITGLSTLAAELEAKRLELLKECLPRLSRVGVLSNPTNSLARVGLGYARPAAERLGLSLNIQEARDATSLDTALERLVRERSEAVMVLTDSFLVSQRRRIAQFALKNRLPSVYTYREHAEAGGLIAYTPNYHDLFRRAAGYVDKILKGAKPGNLPIEQPTKFDLIINLKTAAALGITMPQSLVVRADHLIK